MKALIQFIPCILFSFLFSNGFAQGQKKTELFDLVKKLLPDSTGYDAVGDWSVGKPAAFPVKWNADNIEMSDDLKINFFRKGTAQISATGRMYAEGRTMATWNVLLRGARSGYSSFNISGPVGSGVPASFTIDSLFGKRSYSLKLLQICGSASGAGFKYYQLKIPGKIASFLKLAWTCSNGACVFTLDCYDEWSKQYADLNCK